MSGPVQEFTWTKFLHILQEALKWIVFINFGTGFLFVGVFRIFLYRNLGIRNLGILISLFVGWHLANFLKKLSLKMFDRYEENDLKWRRLGLCGLFILPKHIPQTMDDPSIFLFDVGNGGLMLLLWCWRNYLQDAKDRQIMSTHSTESAPAVVSSVSDDQFSISNCVRALDEILDIDQQLYFSALNLFENPNFRETFISLKDVKIRLTWLQGKCRKRLFR